jgi:hypothetical protein
MGWIMFGDPQHNNVEMTSKYAPDLAKDKFHRLAQRTTGCHLPPSASACWAARRVELGAVGRVPADDARPARDVAGELGDAPLGGDAGS